MVRGRGRVLMVPVTRTGNWRVVQGNWRNAPVWLKKLWYRELRHPNQGEK